MFLDSIIYIYGWWFGTFFSIIYGIFFPIDFHIFQDGYCTTNQILYGCILVYPHQFVP